MTSPPRPLRVCYFGTYRSKYSRNQIMLAGLRAQGVTVYECHELLWHGIEDRVHQLEGGWFKPRFWGRVLKSYWRLWQKHRRLPAYDVMVLGYPGVFDAYPARLLSWWRRRPLVLDHYMSLYLIAEERGLVTYDSVKGRLLRWLEGLGLRLPDQLISDTPQYVEYHSRTYGLAPEDFALVPAGADDRFFYPRPEVTPPADEFRVIYYGTFIPNHGVPTMIRAAALLREYPLIQFHFYGEGPEAPVAHRLTRELALENVHFHGWTEKAALPEKIASSHLCLGVFGVTKQSLMTVQNKIWEAAAMRKPLISGDAPAVRGVFHDGKELYLVDRESPRALADAILAVAEEPTLGQQLADAAYKRFCDGHTPSALGERTKDILKEQVRGRS